MFEQLPPIKPADKKPKDSKQNMKQTFTNFFMNTKKMEKNAGNPIKKIVDHKKNYISPYSIKAMAK